MQHSAWGCVVNSILFFLYIMIFWNLKNLSPLEEDAIRQHECTGSWTATTKEKTHWIWEAEVTWSQSGVRWCSSHCGHLLKQCIRSSPYLWWQLFHYNWLPNTCWEFTPRPTCSWGAALQHGSSNGRWCDQLSGTKGLAP